MRFIHLLKNGGNTRHPDPATLRLLSILASWDTFPVASTTPRPVASFVLPLRLFAAFHLHSELNFPSNLVSPLLFNWAQDIFIPPFRSAGVDLDSVAFFLCISYSVLICMYFLSENLLFPIHSFSLLFAEGYHSVLVLICASHHYAITPNIANESQLYTSISLTK